MTYGWTGSSPEVKYKGSRDGATDAYNKCGAYTAIIVDRHSREVLAEKSSPAGGRADIDKLERYASSNLWDNNHQCYISLQACLIYKYIQAMSTQFYRDFY